MAEILADSDRDMAARTILIHLNDRRRAQRLTAAALAFCGGKGAHVIGLHVSSRMPTVGPVAVPYAEDMMRAIEDAEREESAAIGAAFSSVTDGRPVTAAWRSVKPPGPDLAAFVMQHGRAADVIVAAEGDADWDLAPVLDFPERLALESGRPVLVVPNGGVHDAAPSHALIAWNGSREAARAAFDALAIVDPACRLSVLVIEDGGTGDAAAAGAESFAAAAQRHGFDASALRRPLKQRPIGAAIAEEAAALAADLIVMGAYGHSRFRELVFGGATRHLTHRMTLRTLLSH